MTVLDTLFWFFSITMLLCGVLVITSRNPIHSALALVMLFVCMAGLFMLLGAFFLAAVQVLVYAGAVMVLFLFVIMLLNMQASERRQFSLLGGVGGVLIAGAFAWELAIILRKPVTSSVTGNAEGVGGLESVARLLFANYMLPFEVTAVLLLVAMIGAVLLSRKEDK
jgi:NADH-quinone oxidoreductase subunit J